MGRCSVFLSLLATSNPILSNLRRMSLDKQSSRVFTRALDSSHTDATAHTAPSQKWHAEVMSITTIGGDKQATHFAQQLEHTQRRLCKRHCMQSFQAQPLQPG